MNKLAENKTIQALAYILCMLVSMFFVYRGLSMTDPQTGSFMGVSLTPKGVTLAGLGGGIIWLLWRILSGSNFKRFVMPRPAIIIWCIFFFGGMIVARSLREPGDVRYTIGSVIFAMSALLPFLLYGALGVIMNKYKS
jgi:hypothetical protein